MGFELVIEDNSELVKQAAEEAILRALERCGMTAERYAKQLVPFDTGNLRNSIAHAVDAGEQAAYVGSNSEYAVYVEHGTGVYAENGGGRPTPWVYQDANGDWHYTHGQKAQHFIKPAVADHVSDYQAIIEHELKGGG